MSSYPRPRYDGDAGEVSAAFRPHDAEPDLANPPGPTVHYLSTGAGTGGDFGLYRWDFGERSGGPGPHFHRTIAESFFILSGAVRLYDGNTWFRAISGDFLFVPPGGIHAFRNDPGEAASMLLLFTPGAPREDYFETTMELARGLTMTEEEKADFYRRHDNHWL